MSFSSLCKWHTFVIVLSTVVYLGQNTLEFENHLFSPCFHVFLSDARFSLLLSVCYLWTLKLLPAVRMLPWEWPLISFRGIEEPDEKPCTQILTCYELLFFRAVPSFCSWMYLDILFGLKQRDIMRDMYLFKPGASPAMAYWIPCGSWLGLWFSAFGYRASLLVGCIYNYWPFSTFLLTFVCLANLVYPLLETFREFSYTFYGQ